MEAPDQIAKKDPPSFGIIQRSETAIPPPEPTRAEKNRPRGHFLIHIWGATNAFLCLNVVPASHGYAANSARFGRVRRFWPRIG